VSLATHLAIATERLELRAHVPWLRLGVLGGEGGPVPLLTVSAPAARGAPDALERAPEHTRAHLSAWSLSPSRAPRRPARLDDVELERLWRLALRFAPRYGLARRWLSPPPLPRVAESLDALLPSEGEAREGEEVTLVGRSLDLSLCLSMSLWIAELWPRVGVACSAECDSEGTLRPVGALTAKARALAPCEGVTLLLVARGQEGEAREALAAAGLGGRVEARGVETVEEALGVALGLDEARVTWAEETARELEALSDEGLVELARSLSGLGLASVGQQERRCERRTLRLIEAVVSALASPHRAGARARLGALRAHELSETLLAFRRHGGDVEGDGRWVERTGEILRLREEARAARVGAAPLPARLRAIAERVAAGALTAEGACELFSSRLQSLSDMSLHERGALEGPEAHRLHEEVDALLAGGGAGAGAAKLWGARARWRLVSGLEGALSDALEALARWEELAQSAVGAPRAALLTQTSHPLTVAYRLVGRGEGAVEAGALLDGLERLSDALHAQGATPSWHASVERAAARLRLRGAGPGREEAARCLMSAVGLRVDARYARAAAHALPWGLAHVESPVPYLAGVAALHLAEGYWDASTPWAPVERLFTALEQLHSGHRPYVALQASCARALLAGELDGPVSAALAPGALYALQGLAALARGLGAELDALPWRVLRARYLYC